MYIICTIYIYILLITSDLPAAPSELLVAHDVWLIEGRHLTFTTHHLIFTTHHYNDSFFAPDEILVAHDVWLIKGRHLVFTTHHYNGFNGRQLGEHADDRAREGEVNADDCLYIMNCKTTNKYGKKSIIGNF